METITNDELLTQTMEIILNAYDISVRQWSTVVALLNKHDVNQWFFLSEWHKQASYGEDPDPMEIINKLISDER